MFYAILNYTDKPPVVLEANDLQILQKLSEHAGRELGTLAEAKEWLSSLLPPSGLYTTPDEAKEAIHQIKLKNDAALVAAVLAQQGMTQRELTEILGYAGPENDGKPVRRILAGQQGLSGPARRLLASFLKNKHYLTKAEEDAILSGVLSPQKESA